jgi:hypothetical protein
MITLDVVDMARGVMWKEEEERVRERRGEREGWCRG